MLCPEGCPHCLSQYRPDLLDQVNLLRGVRSVRFPIIPNLLKTRNCSDLSESPRTVGLDSSINDFLSIFDTVVVRCSFSTLISDFLNNFVGGVRRRSGAVSATPKIIDHDLAACGHFETCSVTPRIEHVRDSFHGWKSLRDTNLWKRVGARTPSRARFQPL